MKYRFTCDEVFEILTRAPFPAGTASDASVEHHLAVCHECRQFAEALRPATDLFAEVMTAEEQQSLPSYRGQAAAVMARVRQETCQETFAPPRSTTQHRASRFPGGIIPALGLALLLLIAITGGPGAPDSIRQDSNPSRPAALAASSDACLVAGFSLPANCLLQSAVGPLRHDRDPIQPATPAAKGPTATHYARHLQPLLACESCHQIPSTAAHRQVCCTNCHRANLSETSRRPASVPRLVTACSVCHM